MECIHCGAQWALKDGQTKFAKCPFCGKELVTERTDMRYTDFQQALSAIAQMRGIDYLLEEPSKVLAIFLDITQNLQKEYKLLKLFYSNDTQKVFKNNSGMVDGKLNMAVRSLQENIFMEAASAKYVVNIFADVLGLKKEVDISAMDSEKWYVELKQESKQEKMEPKTPKQMAEKGRPSKNKITVGTDYKSGIATKYEGNVYARNFRYGTYIENEGNVYEIIGCQHVNRGKDAAFVKAKLKDVKNGGMVEKLFRVTEKFPQTYIDKKNMQYLYTDGARYYFMDKDNYEQIALNSEIVGIAMRFVKENEICTICSHKGSVFSVEPPLFVELEITDTEPGIKGYVATDANKPAMVETGTQVYVPLYVEKGDKIKIDTRTGKYLSKV